MSQNATSMSQNEVDENAAPASEVATTDAPESSMDKVLLKKIIEGVLLAVGQPLSETKIAELFVTEEGGEAPSKEEIQTALADIQADCMNRGFELKEVGSGWRFQVRAETAPWVNRLWDEKPQKYSRALLETLSLIAYRQPITRGDIEQIRGVAVSSHIIKTLSEREWVKVVGHRDVPGRPSLYATTRQFLDYFNLKSLDELPSLSELRDLDEMNAELDLTDDEETLESEGIKEAVAELTEFEDDHAGEDGCVEGELDFGSEETTVPAAQTNAETLDSIAPEVNEKHTTDEADVQESDSSAPEIYPQDPHSV